MNLTDEQWAMLEPLIGAMPRRADGRGRPWRNSRDVLNGILWILRTGAQWADLPECYPPWGHPTKTPTDLRKAPVRRGTRQQRGFIVSNDENHPARWGPKSDACIDCGTAERPRRAHGRCKRCDDRWRYLQLQQADPS
jgi:transposase